jgi:hypothetical protein
LKSDGVVEADTDVVTLTVITLVNKDAGITDNTDGVPIEAVGSRLVDVAAVNPETVEILLLLTVVTLVNEKDDKAIDKVGVPVVTVGRELVEITVVPWKVEEVVRPGVSVT